VVRSAPASSRWSRRDGVISRCAPLGSSPAGWAFRSQSSWTTRRRQRLTSVALCARRSSTRQRWNSSRARRVRSLRRWSICVRGAAAHRLRTLSHMPSPIETFGVRRTLSEQPHVHSASRLVAQWTRHPDGGFRRPVARGYTAALIGRGHATLRDVARTDLGRWGVGARGRRLARPSTLLVRARPKHECDSFGITGRDRCGQG
jgi:hypothetical protein